MQAAPLFPPPDRAHAAQTSHEWIEYEKAVEVLAERYGLVMLCEEKGLPFAREARDEGRFGVWVVSRASGVDYCEVLTDVKRKWKADHQ